MRTSKETHELAPSALHARVEPFHSAELQALLLELSIAAAHGGSADQAIKLFCEKSRGLLKASAAYFWELQSKTSLIVVAAEGTKAEEAVGDNLGLGDSSVINEALQQRGAVHLNHPDPHRYPWETQVGAMSAIAAPVMAAGVTRGALVFTHCSRGDFFAGSHLAVVELLAAQLGALLEQ